MRYVSEVEWELLKSQTAAHLLDRSWRYAVAKTPPVERSVTPREPEEPRYYSGNYPGKVAE